MKKLFSFLACAILLVACSEPIQLGGQYLGSSNTTTTQPFSVALSNSNQLIDQYIDQGIEAINKITTDKAHFAPISKLASALPRKLTTYLNQLDDYQTLLVNEGGLYLYDGTYNGKTVGRRKEYYLQKGFSNFKMTDDQNLEGCPVKHQDKSAVKNMLSSKGKDLNQTLENAGRELSATLEEAWKQQEQGNIFGVRFTMPEFEQLKAQLALKRNNEQNSAETALKRMNVAEACAMMQKYQNDIKVSIGQIINYFVANLSITPIVHDKVEVFANSAKPFILLGETYEAEIALGAYSSQAEFSVNVGGRALKVEDGKAKFTTRPSSIGTQSFTANIIVKNPLTGKIVTTSKEFNYEVGVPSVTASPDKMNVFYVGVDNPISLAAAGISSNDLSVSITGGGATIKPAGGKGKYIVNATRPTTSGKFCEIRLFDQRKNRVLASFPFRVKDIPDPIVQLANGRTDGVIKAAEMRVMRGIMAVLENFDFDAKCKIQGFTMYYTAKGKAPVELINSGGRFNGKIKQLVEQAATGDIFIFTNVKGRYPKDVADRKLTGLAFIIR